MPRVHITDRAMPKLVGKQGKQTDYTDTKLRGFALRVSRNGIRSFVLRYTSPVDNRQRRWRIGGEELTASQAREIAADAVAALRFGVDPQTESAATEQGAWTCDELLDKFEAEQDRLFGLGELAASTVYARKRLLEKVIRPKLTGILVADVNLELIETIVRSITGKKDKTGKRINDGRYQQNRCVQVLNAIFQIAVTHGQIERLPTEGIKRNREAASENLLTIEELGRIGAALNEMEQEGRTSICHIELIRLLALTGSRFGEIASLRWSDVDFERGELQPSTYKNITRNTTGKPKVIPLSPDALSVLQRMTRLRVCEFVFPTKSADGDWVPISGIWKMWKRVLKCAGVDLKYRVHDIRHSFGSALAHQGVPLPVIAAVLRHKDLKSTSGYLHSEPERERVAVDAVGKIIGKALDPQG